MDKILKLSKLFGVSTDYLLKDEMEETEQEMVNAYDAEIRCIFCYMMSRIRKCLPLCSGRH